ncbi:MAG: hypothetical protein ACREED_02390 [Stellaceae bacterium]
MREVAALAVKSFRSRHSSAGAWLNQLVAKDFFASVSVIGGFDQKRDNGNWLDAGLMTRTAYGGMVCRKIKDQTYPVSDVMRSRQIR